MNSFGLLFVNLFILIVCQSFYPNCLSIFFELISGSLRHRLLKLSDKKKEKFVASAEFGIKLIIADGILSWTRHFLGLPTEVRTLFNW